MEIRKIEVKVFKKILTCAKTDCEGNYEFTGKLAIVPSKDPLTPGTPAFSHQCTVCGEEQIFEQKFPQIEYEEVS